MLATLDVMTPSIYALGTVTTLLSLCAIGLALGAALVLRRRARAAAI